MPDVRPCEVSFTDGTGVTHSVEVNASSVFEAAITGMGAMKVPGWWNDPGLSIRVRVKTPGKSYVVGTAVLVKWLGRQGTTPKDVVLKERLREMVKSPVPRALP